MLTTHSGMHHSGSARLPPKLASHTCKHATSTLEMDKQSKKAKQDEKEKEEPSKGTTQKRAKRYVT